MIPFCHNEFGLQGQRIALRNLLPTDVNSRYLSWLLDKDINRLMAPNLPTKLSELRQYYRRIKSSKDAMIFAIVLIKNNKHIGNVTLQHINMKERSATFGLLIGDKKYWNKGYGKEATNLVLSYGFFILGLQKVFGPASYHHKVSLKLLRGLRFKVGRRTKERIWFQMEIGDFLKG